MKKLIIIFTFFIIIHSFGAEDMSPPAGESRSNAVPSSENRSSEPSANQPATERQTPVPQVQPETQPVAPSETSRQAAGTIREAENRITDTMQNNATRSPGEIRIYGGFQWGNTLTHVRKRFKRLRVKQEIVENNVIRITVFLPAREKKFKLAQYFFTGKKLSGVRLEYRYKYVLFANARKEMIYLTRSYGNYKQLEWNRRKVLKWESKTTLLYYTFVFNRNRAAYNIYRFYADKKNAAGLLKFIPDNTLYSIAARAEQPSVYVLKSENWYKADGTLSHRIQYEYNEKNQNTKLTQFNFIGQIELYTLFEYNTAGELIEEKTFAANNQPVEIKKYFIVNGKVVSASITEHFGSRTKVTTVSYVRNESGDVIREVWKDGSGNQLYVVEIQYNAFNMPVQIEHVKVYERDGREVREMFRKQVFQYNENKKIHEIQTMEANGKVVQAIEYRYEDDRLTSTIVKQPSPNYQDNTRRFLDQYITQFVVKYEYIAGR